MKIILAILLGLILVGCSQSNYAQKKTVISNMSDFLKVNEAVCSKYKSTDKKIYGWGTSTSKDFELSKAKSLLQAIYLNLLQLQKYSYQYLLCTIYQYCL